MTPQDHAMSTNDVDESAEGLHDKYHEAEWLILFLQFMYTTNTMYPIKYPHSFCSALLGVVIWSVHAHDNSRSESKICL